ncbi:phosphoethanolamine transferase [Salmonella enterica subsp. enterica serovar Choleraesuis]|nr:phosphoethanolamine transferase [Salmonella enterica subsp. enterica serovar Choleraesuis]
MLVKRIPPVNFISVMLVLVAWFTLVLNLPVLIHFWHILQAIGQYKIGFLLSIPVVLFSALTFVFMPLSFRVVLKPVFCSLLLVTAVTSYAQYKYQVIFDRSMIENILETNTAEANSYSNLSVALWIIIGGALPAILLAFTPISYGKSWSIGLIARFGFMLGALAIIILIACFYYKDYASVGRNNRSLNHEIQPTNYIFSSVKYISKRYFSKPLPYRTVAADAHLAAQAPGAKPTLIFMVVGETARAENMSWQGYNRDTNPYTRSESDAVYYRNVSSCGTATAISVPCMFSNLTRKHYDGNVARSSDNLIDVVRRAGIETWWSDNDEGCKGACDGTPNQIISDAATNPLCDGSTCYDGALLQSADDKITADGKSKLMIFHLIGSHGPTYYRRYPTEFAKFLPDCRRSDIENCTQQQLINTYDNTLLYTDYVVGQFIEKLKKYQQDYNVALYYISDHGESLGEKGLYLHGTPYNFAPSQQTHVPMLLWMPDNYLKADNLDVQCVRKAADQQDFSHDNVFHTVLAMLKVETKDYNPGLDALAGCRHA